MIPDAVDAGQDLDERGAELGIGGAFQGAHQWDEQALVGAFLDQLDEGEEAHRLGLDVAGDPLVGEEIEDLQQVAGLQVDQRVDEVIHLLAAPPHSGLEVDGQVLARHGVTARRQRGTDSFGMMTETMMLAC
jgi:hypothetical protein